MNAKANRRLPTLTKKQKLVLDYIGAFIQEHGYRPSYEEIAAGLGLSSQSTICVHVENLKNKGYLTKKDNTNRSVDLLRSRTRRRMTEEVPLMGLIAAGLPIEAVQDRETISIPADMLGRTETYVLQVTGDSMTGDHVLDGDYVIVSRQETACDGDMVVALIHNSEATLKRYHRQGAKIRLEPANPAYHSLVYDEADVAVQGVVVGILRKYRR
jgi:repressor LexA